MLESALQIASHIHLPVTVVAFALVLPQLELERTFFR